MITSNNQSNIKRYSGYTLVEIMVSVAILSLVLAAMLSSFSFFSKGTVSLGQYVTMSSASRYGLELLARDIHGAETITVAGKQALTVIMPVDAGGTTIQYLYDDTTDELTRTVTDTSGTSVSDVIFDHLTEFEIYYYDRLENEIDRDSGNLQANVIAQGKSILLEAKLVKKAINKENSDYIISARFMMRNYNGT